MRIFWCFVRLTCVVLIAIAAAAVAAWLNLPPIAWAFFVLAVIWCFGSAAASTREQPWPRELDPEEDAWTE
jgi:hypothetical protein